MYIGELVRASASTTDEDLSFGPPVIAATVVLIAGGLWLLSRWRSAWSGAGSSRIVPADRGALVLESIHPYAGIPILSLGVMLLVIGVTASVSGPVSDVLWAITSLVMLATAVSWGLLATIALFNRPKSLVPPHARDSNGYLGDLGTGGRRGG
ncbi:hypothetical protein E1212_00205 [Jiangella ureilytica]|uniref:Uncharacterized protein n=1 Tax=Jiangella ureilytica TaxID=2530374 RepID=A0A4R4S331_9ACTN|nr:hypothetical protein [Jiangella ureilytica]TDC56921.1 hypothetical protein E1212_00205 [Jiangella ureilytica]